MEDGATVSIGINHKNSERVVLFGLLTQAKTDGDFSMFQRITFYLSWILDNLGKAFFYNKHKITKAVFVVVWNKNLINI